MGTSRQELLLKNLKTLALDYGAPQTKEQEGQRSILLALAILGDLIAHWDD